MSDEAPRNSKPAEPDPSLTISMSSLTEDEAAVLRVMRSLSPDQRRSMRLAGRALLALSEARKLAEEAIALAPQWGPMIAECMRDDANRLAPPAARKEGAE